MQTVETDVLVVGSGPAGAAAAAALSTYGVANTLVTRYDRLTTTPRAHITNQRTLEVLRDLGLEGEAIAKGTPQHLMGTTTFCTTIAGEELGRLRSWGNDPLVQAAHELASPTRMCDLPQTLMEPLLVDAAVARGTRLRFGTRFLSLTQDDDGVTATVADEARGDTYDIRARYLVGADGGRSLVAEQLGLPFEGEMGVAGSINIVFRTDLARYTAHRPSTLYWVLQTGSEVGGIGMGLVRCVRPWDEWLIVWGYDVDAGPPDLTPAYAESVVRLLLGDDEIPVEIVSSSAWTVNHLHATTLSTGRVFCVGDAVHRHPPSNGLGSNTSIQDSWNLAWKLAHVIRGGAGPALLETYTAERAPVAAQVVARANRSIAETGPVFGALGLLSTSDGDQMQANMAARKGSGPDAAAQREALRKAIAHKVYEFNAHGVELNQRYASTAVVDDGAGPEEWTVDPELVHVPTTRPGAKVPHAWLTRAGHEVSTLDLVGRGGFTVLTGPGGEAWTHPEVRTHVVGPGQEHEDPYGDWARLREVADDGCVLVRPDGYVCFRSAGTVDDPAAVLAAALDRVLARGTGFSRRGGA